MIDAKYEFVELAGSISFRKISARKLFKCSL